MSSEYDRRTDPTVRTRDGRENCWNCDAWVPYKPSKVGGTSCPNCDSDLRQ